MVSWIRFFNQLVLLSVLCHLVTHQNLTLLAHFTFTLLISFFLDFFSIFPYFPRTSLSFILSSEQLYVHCNFHQRPVHMLLRCDCLIPFYCQTFCHNNVNRAQRDFPLYVFFTPIFQCQFFVTCHTHTCLLFFMGVLAAVIS